MARSEGFLKTGVRQGLNYGSREGVRDEEGAGMHPQHKLDTLYVTF